MPGVSRAPHTILLACSRGLCWVVRRCHWSYAVAFPPGPGGPHWLRSPVLPLDSHRDLAGILAHALRNKPCAGDPEREWLLPLPLPMLSLPGPWAQPWAAQPSSLSPLPWYKLSLDKNAVMLLEGQKVVPR